MAVKHMYIWVMLPIILELTIDTFSLHCPCESCEVLEAIISNQRRFLIDL